LKWILGFLLRYQSPLFVVFGGEFVAFGKIFFLNKKNLSNLSNLSFLSKKNISPPPKKNLKI
jgi:hypothetical protein